MECAYTPPYVCMVPCLVKYRGQRGPFTVKFSTFKMANNGINCST